MPYNMDGRERMELCPPKGTKAVLKKQAKKKGQAMSEYAAEILANAAGLSGAMDKLKKA